MTLFWSFLCALWLAAPAGAAQAEGPVQRIILPGNAARLSCSACEIVVPAGASLVQSAAPQSIPALAGAPIGLADEGRGISPEVVTPQTAALEPELEATTAALSRSVDQALPALSESVRLGEWKGHGTTLEQSCCGDAAPKLGMLLRNMGYGIHVVEAEMHYYLLHALAGGQIVVDPTIRQFFGGARAPPEVPVVFVGTIGRLHALFDRHAAAKTTRFGMHRLYFAKARVRNAHMLEIQQALGQKPPRVDMEPLRLFLERTSPR